jgi:hypothetical protein
MDDQRLRTQAQTTTTQMNQNQVGFRSRRKPQLAMPHAPDD